jgi:hypothetical protein
MIAGDLALALDPVLIAERVGIVPDDWQRDALRSDTPRALWNCSRQSGKSTCAALLAIHTAIYDPGSLTLLLSPTERQSGELFKKAIASYSELGRPVPTASETTLALTLASGSRIVSLPGREGSIRGYSNVRRLIVDEASRVDDGLFYAILPMLAVSGGSLLAMTTPAGKRGFFHSEWVDGGPGWQRVEVPATDVPRISPDFLDEQRRRMPARWFRQEYLCAFEEADDAVFMFDDIAAMIRPELEPLPW